jgi:hypothetical protein
MWKHGTPALLFMVSSLTTRLLLEDYPPQLRIAFLVFGGCSIIYLIYGLISPTFEIIRITANQAL